MFRRAVCLAAFALLAFSGFYFRGPPVSGAAGLAEKSQTQAIKTVFLIVMENHNWSDIAGSGDAPYINHTLLPMASYAEQYYNPPGNHPSLPNYLWLEAGSSLGVSDDNDPSAHVLRTNQHLVHLLDRARVSWRAYEENISGSTCPRSNQGLYAVRHDPFVYFLDVFRSSAYCIAHIRPYQELAGDLQHNRVARYNFITPNICDDMHSSCTSSYGTVRQGDLWLSHAVPPILHSAAYRRGGALFITWDEGEGGDGPIGLIVLSPAARGHGYANHVRYTHSSMLRTVEEIFHVSPLLRNAAHAPDLRGLFTRFP